MSNSEFSAREFLRSRRAVLVHFSTVMSARSDLIFPDDLRRALSLANVPLSFSTIQPGDTNPYVVGGRGGAEGSVGIVVDIGARTVVRSVSASDSGSSELGSLGNVANEENCAASIDMRERSNEWHVQDYIPMGLFVMPPIVVRKSLTIEGVEILGEEEIELKETIELFPDLRIFGASNETFYEYNRATEQWEASSYDQIIPK